MRIYLKKSRQVLGSLKKDPARLLRELRHGLVKQLVNMNLAVTLNLLPEELYKLVGHHRVNLRQVLGFREGVGDVSLVLFQKNYFLLDDELLWILGEEVSELLDVLA